MRLRLSSATLLVFLLFLSSNVKAQLLDLPYVFRYSFTLPEAQRTGGPHELSTTVRIYANDSGGAPIWVERFQVTPTSSWRLSFFLGSTTEGLPPSIFQHNEARWISVEIDGFEESARAALISVPYALKARDADTLGGKSLSAIVDLLLHQGTANSYSSVSSLTKTTAILGTARAAFLPSANYIPLWLDGAGTMGNSLLYQDSHGNLGIGTSTPGQALDVIGRVRYRSNDKSSAGFWMTDSAGVENAFVGLYGFASDSPFGFWHGGAWRMLINASGNVGIGIVEPSAKFDVNGRAKFRSDGINSGGFWLTDSQGTEEAFLGLTTPSSNSPYGFWHGGAWRMTIAPTGNIGIGTFAPSALLEIAGNVKISGGGTLTFADGSVQTTAATSQKISLSSPDSSIAIAGTTSAPTLAIQSVSLSKLSGNGCAAGTLLQWSGTTWVCASLAASDASISVTSAGSTTKITVADLGITTAKIADGSVTAAKLAPGAITASGFASLGPNSYTGDQNIRISGPTIYALNAVNTDTTSFGGGIYTESASASGIGIKAHALAPTGGAAGVYAVSESSTGYGVFSVANATTGLNYGVYGQSRSSLGTGVKGESVSSSGTTYGVYGQTAGANNSAGVYGIAPSTTASSIHYGVYGRAEGIYGIGVIGYAPNVASGAGNPIGVVGRTDSSRGIAGHFTNSAVTGNILVLQNGTGNVWRVDNSGNQWMNGTMHTGGADFAEAVEAIPSPQSYEPGDLLAIATSSDRMVELSGEPYSTRVIGVYATKPGVLASRHGLDVSGREIPVAMIGIVPAKASAENGPIQRGDLLVSATTPGCVMRATDRQRLVGAVVGKAMQPLESGVSVIEIAVTLQ